LADLYESLRAGPADWNLRNLALDARPGSGRRLDPVLGRIKRIWAGTVSSTMFSLGEVARVVQP